MAKPSRFKINHPPLDNAAVKEFAAAAEIIPEEKQAILKVDPQVTAKTPTETPEIAQNSEKLEVDTNTLPTKEKKLVAPKLKSKQEKQWPWSDIDDKTARTTGYTLQFPASVYAKLKFLGENEPGGPSVRKIVMEALDVHLEKKLAKYIKTK